MFCYHITERKLQVHKVSHSLNITDLQTGFIVECMIKSHLNEKSVFKVTWFRKQTNKQPQTIFTLNQNGTLHNALPNRTLVYDRPSTSNYTLALRNVDPSDDGQYQCQVVEYQQTALNTWTMVAEDNSGELSITVHTLSTGHTTGNPNTFIPVYFIVFLMNILILF